MKIRRPLFPGLFIPIGLLLVTAPFLINDYVKIPDFVRGLLTGLGFGLEIMAFINLKRRKRDDVPG